MQKPKIIVTRRWPKPVEDRLAEHFDVTFNSTDTAMTTAQLQHALQHCDALLPTVSDAINANVLGVRPMQAKALGSYGVGFNHIDLTAARAAGLTVTNTPDVLTELRAMDNVLILPHLGSATLETRIAMGNRVVDNMTAFFRGDTPPDRVA